MFIFKSSPSQGPSGHSVGNCRSGQTLKKPKYLSACDREECGRGEGAVVVEPCTSTSAVFVVYY